jgi:hypothetical protein
MVFPYMEVSKIQETGRKAQGTRHKAQGTRKVQRFKEEKEERQGRRHFASKYLDARLVLKFDSIFGARLSGVLRCKPQFR